MWTTDEPSTSIVEYGTTSSLGSAEAKYTYTKNHTITITGLNPGSVCYFKVKSSDSWGNSSANSIRHVRVQPNIEWRATVLSVIDGDSMYVVSAHYTGIIRLACVDAEETSLNRHAIKRHPELEGMSNADYRLTEYYQKALAAKNCVEGLISPGDEIGLDTDDENPKDVYNRPIVVVWVQVNGTWTNLNRELVRLGYAEIFQDVIPQYNVPTEFDPWSWRD